MTAPSECLTSPGGTDYFGHVNTTVSGRTGMRWDSQSPHSHEYAYAKDQGNYCRNPYGKSKGPWCFTTDPNKTWEYCSIPCMVSVQMLTWIIYTTFICMAFGKILA